MAGPGPDGHQHRQSEWEACRVREACRQPGFYNVGVSTPSDTHPVSLVHDRIEFEALLSNVSAPLGAVDSDRLDDIVRSALEAVRFFFGADRCALCAITDNLQTFAQIVTWVNDDRRITHEEEWTEADELRDQFGTERFTRLMALLETAAELPVVEFRVIARIRAVGGDVLVFSSGHFIRVLAARRVGGDNLTRPVVRLWNDDRRVGD